MRFFDWSCSAGVSPSLERRWGMGGCKGLGTQWGVEGLGWGVKWGRGEDQGGE
jgi:hypothetical protein